MAMVMVVVLDMEPPTGYMLGYKDVNDHEGSINGVDSILRMINEVHGFCEDHAILKLNI